MEKSAGKSAKFRLIGKKKRKDLLFAVILLLPTFYILFKTFLFPIYQSLVWSMYKYHMLDGSDVVFVGFSNFTALFKNHDFWTATYFTGYFTVISTVAELVLGLFSALLLNQMFRGRVFFRMIIIIPWAMLTLVNGLLWKWIFQPGNGSFTIILKKIHVLSASENPLWLADAHNIINSVVVADVWKMTPFMTLLLLAGLQAIPSTLYEAAMMDGAGFWKKLWYVTIPQLFPILMIAVVLRTIAAFRVYDILTVFTGDPTTSISYLTFNKAFRYFYLGEASAMAWVSTAIILVFIVLYIRMLKKDSQEV
ncbi:sugar ABC transporter permease [Fictibacillus enclensis]|uniref:carbohydrate ABC transporter permease n=1 Tax=Fictibacillus enclensis TaxID=1017270 RepID=UPI00259FF263|nr:sugar ABC transporter permease [Fictibacillus enclensis]MDM5199299.1 sugar ABC transporter permease [Fictibacillus enclensis]